MNRRPPPRASRAAAQFAWTEPLRPLHKRYRKLAAASYRLGAIALGSLVFIAMARSRTGLGKLWIGILCVIAIAGISGLFLGRAAAAKAREVESEIDRLESEAEQHLPR